MNAAVDETIVAVDESRIELEARDGYRLHGTHYVSGTAVDRDAAVVFNAGGGLAFARYRHFLRFLAREGFAVLAYDYRGVGASRPARLRGFDAGLEDWSEHDQAAAIDWMHARYPAKRIAAIAHSIGALVACGAPNAHTLDRIVLVSPHTGYWRDYASAWRVPMTAWWHFAMPAISRAVGFFPGRALHLGDDVPLRFALQWARRRTPSFRVDDESPQRERGHALLDNARTLALPVMAIAISDDAFATAAGVERFVRAIPRASVLRTELDAKRLGHESIGHFGFFRRRHSPLWPIVSRFLERPASIADASLTATGT